MRPQSSGLLTPPPAAPAGWQWPLGHSAHPRTRAGVLPSAAMRPGTLTGQPCPFLGSRVVSANSQPPERRRGQGAGGGTLDSGLDALPSTLEGGGMGGLWRRRPGLRGPRGNVRSQLPSGSRLGLSLGEICFLLQDREMSYFFLNFNKDSDFFPEGL